MKRLTGLQQKLLYIAPFPPLALFKIWAAPGRTPESLLIAAGLMLVYCIVVIIVSFILDKPTYFDWAVAAYFAIAACLLYTMPEKVGPFLREHAITGIYSTLFAVAFLPPIFRLDPFTYHYAKKTAPKEFWDHPIFININRIMTYAWAGIFAVCIAISLYPSLYTRALIPIALILGIGIPFNMRFPDYYLKRMGLPSRKGLRVITDEENSRK